MKLTPVQPKAEEVVTFEDWAREKFVEINANINPCDDNGDLDPVRLNQVLTKFAGHFAWAVTMQEVESNKLNIASHEYDIWYKSRYNEALRLIQTEHQSARVPGQNTIDSRMVDMCSDELESKRITLENMKSRVSLLKDFVRVLDKQASILQTLSSNMRSELFFAGGVSVNESTGGRKLNESQKNDATKSLLQNAIRAQGQEVR